MRHLRRERLEERVSDLQRPQPVKATRLEWTIAVLTLVVQQGAFVSIPLYFRSASLQFREDQSVLNTIAVGASLVSMLWLCFRQRTALRELATRNVLSLLFLVLVFLSSAWSIHPDLSLRRGVGYLLTLMIAAYLTVRLDINDRLKALSYSFGISAIGSLLFIGLFPSDGIMHFAELSGNWRGVFPHKNVLGPVMAVAIFIELFILSTAQRSKWHYALLAMFVFLVLMSHSATAFLLTAFYFTCAFAIALTRRSALVGILAWLTLITFAVMLLIMLSFDPQLLLALLGKDSTLTGRTTLWNVVVKLIMERPALGYGYRAMWAVDDPITIYVNRLVGGWGVGNSHNSFLELALQLGVLGLMLILSIIVSAFIRAFKCWRLLPEPLGAFSFVYFIGTLLAAQTIQTLGQNQVIEWVVFNVLLFSCGVATTGRKITSTSSIGAAAQASQPT